MGAAAVRSAAPAAPAFVEEPVDGRTGAADVGAEGAELAQLVGDGDDARSFGGSAGEVAGACDRGEQRGHAAAS